MLREVTPFQGQIITKKTTLTKQEALKETKSKTALFAVHIYIFLYIHFSTVSNLNFGSEFCPDVPEMKFFLLEL